MYVVLVYLAALFASWMLYKAMTSEKKPRDAYYSAQMHCVLEQDGPNGITEYPLSGTYFQIGRARNRNDICIRNNDETISRIHAKLQYKNGEFLLIPDRKRKYYKFIPDIISWKPLCFNWRRLLENLDRALGHFDCVCPVTVNHINDPLTAKGTRLKLGSSCIRGDAVNICGVTLRLKNVPPDLDGVKRAAAESRRVQWAVFCATLLFIGIWTVYVYASLRDSQNLPVQAFLTFIAIFTGFYLIGSLFIMNSHASCMSILSATVLLLVISCGYQLIFDNKMAVWYKIEHFFVKQMIYRVAGILIGTIIFVVWRRVNQLNTPLFIVVSLVTLAMILALAPKNVEINGAYNWIIIAGRLIQPVDIIRVLLIFLGASAVNHPVRSLVCCFLNLGFVVLLLYLDDKGGAVIQLLMLGVFIYLLIETQKNKLRMIAFSVIVVVAMAMVFYVKGYTRMVNFGNAMTNASSSQQRDLLLCIIFGGWKGLGPAGAIQLVRTFAADNDMAIAGIMAVYGVPVMVCVMTCYAVIVCQTILSPVLYPSSFLILVQSAISIFAQVVLNFGGSVDILPFTGVNAPIISSGGTSMLFNSVLLGLCFASIYPKFDMRRER